MQPAPGPADYQLLREGAVAALQFLYLDVITLGRRVCTSEASKRPILSGDRVLAAEIGESCCNQPQSHVAATNCNPHVAATVQCTAKASGKVCLLYLCPVILSFAHSLTRLLSCTFVY